MSRRKVIAGSLLVLLIGAAIFLFIIVDHEVKVVGLAEKLQDVIVPEHELVPDKDEMVKPLANPPSVIKAIYSTGWSAGSEKRLKYFFDLLDTTELNAIVIDVKDYTGVISYETDVELSTYEKRISDIDDVIQRLHDKGVYVIARIAVFEDNELVKKKPEWALHSSSTGGVWRDRKGIAWLDAAAAPVWQYNVAIAKDALRHGFDEINFDYIRFPTDGDISDITFPFYDGVESRSHVLTRFFSFLKSELSETKISADVFGEVAYVRRELAIGQNLEEALKAFDAVAPMVYPSHYAKGFLGFANPAQYPYEVVQYSLSEAYKRLTAYNQRVASSSLATTTVDTDPLLREPLLTAKIRPWLQDFDLGADYDAAAVRKQIIAAEELGDAGWMLWSPSNVYTKGALRAE